MNQRLGIGLEIIGRWLCGGQNIPFWMSHDPFDEEETGIRCSTAELTPPRVAVWAENTGYIQNTNPMASPTQFQ